MSLEIAYSQTRIVGVLNVTPDSFSDGGKFFSPQQAIDRAFELVEEGADIIDIGAESTRPGSQPIGLEEEWKRLAPVLEGIGGKLIVSLDTYKAEIARRGAELGVQIINDISALRADQEMGEVIADRELTLVMMYSKEQGSAPHATHGDILYRDIAEEISGFLRERIKHALNAGISEQRIILDPGIGLFVSNKPEVSWELLRRVDELKSLGFPLYVGASRKGFLNTPFYLEPEDRDPVSALISGYLVEKGVQYLRVHNVKMTKNFLQYRSRKAHQMATRVALTSSDRQSS
jgi:dihydropteroate synthase